MYRFIIALIFLSFISCQDDDDIPNPTPSPLTGLLKNKQLESNGIEREYHLFVPDNYSNQPLVVLLHGNRSSHDDIIGEDDITAPFKVWLSKAEQDDFLVLIPNGTLGSNNRRGWNDCRTDAVNNPIANDVLFIEDLLDSLENEYNFDNDKVYVAGISNGGQLAFRLTQEIPDRITAFASVAASIPENSACSESTVPISALFMNGTDDPILPYFGGEMASNRGTVLSTQQSVNYWTTRNGISTSPIIENFPDINTTDDCTVIKSLYQNGDNNTEVAHYEIVGGGHTEPSIQERYSNVFLIWVGKQNGDIEMADEIWNFFKDKSK